jgi:hypothetical protein
MILVVWSDINGGWWTLYDSFIDWYKGHQVIRLNPVVSYVNCVLYDFFIGWYKGHQVIRLNPVVSYVNCVLYIQSDWFIYQDEN